MPIVAECKIKGYHEKKKMQILDPVTEPLCQICKKGLLHLRDHVERHIKKEETGEKLCYLIPRGKCTNPDCRAQIRILPHGEMLPNKHYDTEAITDVLDGVITPDSPLEYPSTQTMRRWMAWLLKNRETIEGVMRSAAYRIMGFGEELLKSSGSLLSRLRQDTDSWLIIIIQVIYNSGNRLEPVR